MTKPSDGQDISGLNGFIVPGGEFIALEDVDRMCAYIASVYDSAEKIENLIRGLAMECVSHSMYAAACGYLGKLLALLEDTRAKADCLLKMGQVMEQAGDFEKALQHYTEAFDFPDSFFAERVWRLRRPRPDERELVEAAALLARARLGERPA